MELFRAHDWPGNVRELENLVKRMTILGSDDAIRRELSDAIEARHRAAGPIPALQPRMPAAASPVPAGPMQPVVPAPRQEPPLPVTGLLKDIARQAAREAERELIFRTLHQTRWNRREAAELLGISYKALLYKIKEAEPDRAS